MIIQPSHTHSVKQPEVQPFHEVLSAMLAITEDFLSEKTSEEIGGLKRYYEQKVYLSYSDDPSQYLLHMLHKNKNEAKDEVAQYIFQRQKKVVKDIKHKKYTLKQNHNKNKIKQIRDELSQKLSEMKDGMKSLSQVKILNKNSKGEEESEELYHGYMQFRKKGYWKEKSVGAEKVHSFLSKMKKLKHQLQADHEKNEKAHEKMMKVKQEKEKKYLEEQRRKIRNQLNQRREKAKSARQRQLQQNEQRKKEVQNFLKNYKTDKAAHLINEQKFRKEILQPAQAQRKRKLAEIKKQKQPLDPQQLELHQQRYEQFKQKLVQTYEKRKEDDQGMYERNLQKLRDLYHSHFHDNVEEQMKNYQHLLQQRKKFRERVDSYSGSIKYEFKPKVDQKKREQVEKTIKLLEEQAAKGKKRIINDDGSVTFQEYTSEEQRRIGISNLQFLRKFNEGKKRKEDRSTSMVELSKKHTPIDYLKIMRQQSRVQSAKTKTKRGGWRKIINNQNFSNRDKYASVMDQVQLFEHEAKQKEIQLKYIKGGDKALELKEEVDKFYLESLAAKMHVLKDVMLN